MIERTANEDDLRSPIGAMINQNPQLFRLNIEVGDLERAAAFYNKLLGMEGVRQPGSRIYYNCGAVTIQIIGTAADGPHTLPKAVHFSVDDLDYVFENAKALECVSFDDVHGVSGGEIGVNSLGERSFYAYDPWGNPLCFVESTTVLEIAA